MFTRRFATLLLLTFLVAGCANNGNGGGVGAAGSAASTSASPAPASSASASPVPSVEPTATGAQTITGTVEIGRAHV